MSPRTLVIVLLPARADGDLPELPPTDGGCVVVGCNKYHRIPATGVIRGRAERRQENEPGQVTPERHRRRTEGDSNVQPFALATAWLSLALSGAAAALSPPPPPDVSIDSPTRVHVAAGSATEWSFTVTNLWNQPLPVMRVGGFMDTSDEALAGYTFVPLTDACGAPYVDGMRRLTFPITGPVATGASLRCTYRIERGSDAVHDLLFRLCSTYSTFCGKSLGIGSLPQMRLRVEQVHPVPFDAATALVRLHVDNLSDWSIPQRDVATGCEEFHGGQGPPRPFVVNTDIEGGCAVGEPASCGNFGGQNYFSYGFRLGPFAPGESQSCLLQLQFHQGARSFLKTSVYFSDFRVMGEDGAIGVGTLGTYEGVQPLGITVTPAANPAPVQVPAGRLGALFFALAVLGTALVALVRRR